MGIQQDLEDLRRVNAELDEQEKTLALRRILKIILIGFFYGREVEQKHARSLAKQKEIVQRIAAYFNQLNNLRTKLDSLSKIDAYVARIEEQECGKQLASLKDDLKFLVTDYSSGTLSLISNGFERYREVINCCLANYLEFQAKSIEARVKAIVGKDTYLIYSEKQKVVEVLNSFCDDLDYFQSKHALVETCNSYQVLAGKYRQTIADYNKEFLSRRKQEYASLFVKPSYVFDNEQKEAVLTDDRFNLVVAAAGSGKTEALITRIAYLIKRKPDIIQPNRILAIAYQRKDAKQITDRLLRDHGIDNVDVMTFHKLGKEILLKADVTIDRNSLLDENKKPEAIRALYKNRLKEPDYYKLFIEYVKTLHDRDSKSTPESKSDSLDYAKGRPYTSINNIHVRSKAEKEILDFFLTHKLNGFPIDVVYELDAEGFRPDFYLPKYDIFIEHWALNEKGEVPVWFDQSSEEYKKNKELKKKWFAENNKILIETYASEYDPTNPNKFIDLLKARVLDKIKAHFPETYEFAPVSYDELVMLAWGPYKNQVDEIINFITIAKTFGLNPKCLEEKLQEGKWSAKQRLYGSLALQILEDYESYLSKNEKIDFEDLINRAILELEKNPNLCANLYDQILIDEYQDISAQRYKLIKTLVDRNPSGKLFCVGDDWQSIMGFSGSNLDFFVNFAKYFENPAVTKISTNYRSVKTIVDAGAELIKRNGNSQISKVTKSNGANGEPIKVVRSPHKESYKKRYFEDIANDCLTRIIEYQAAGVLPKDILVVTRFMRTRLNQGYRFHQAIKILKEVAVEKNVDLVLDDARNTNKVRVLTAHKSKGLEAKVVFILNVIKDTYGFPCEIEDSSIYDPARENYPEQKQLDEERRLFYVAMTRAREDLIIYTWEPHVSDFIHEIAKYSQVERLTY
jgi:DNA helicase-4